jgi:hypothetical protein
MRKQYHFWPGEGGIDAWDVDLLIGRVAHLPVEEVALDDIPEIDSEYWFDERERPTVRKVVVLTSFRIEIGSLRVERRALVPHQSALVRTVPHLTPRASRSTPALPRQPARPPRTNRHDATSWRSGPQRCHIVAVALDGTR